MLKKFTVLDLKFVRKNIDLVRDTLKKRGIALDINMFLELDEKRRSILKEVETLNAQRNLLSAEISRIKKRGEEPKEQLTKIKILS
ncbi:MAG TPA: serine--tRNA ligase, partial [Candidatus Desulfofervidus auxilii]|nr:serine--tRNA ligase [Candidatus Desulfofervidus auxilii]